MDHVTLAFIIAKELNQTGIYVKVMPPFSLTPERAISSPH
jgi:hypothetical protein